ncbi:Hypothetical protein PHPALM_36457 [Phytophthora palmivora]|uniref:Uncharacterized protein n=1 Tax=Phytophthora palmivora TaxID=4796 RepID=A0A2P4WZW2_9STRA|nr:Hypothetical protein PHPALM_36457 [Phytophthora palmivora]
MTDKVFSIVCPQLANCTSTCQPLDVGIKGELNPKNTNVKRIGIIKRTITAWNSIAEKTVQTSFTIK